VDQKISPRSPGGREWRSPRKDLGANNTFKVTFKPTASGTRSATLKILSNDANENSFDIQLDGTGAAP
jgi:hypothetical protein